MESNHGACKRLGDEVIVGVGVDSIIIERGKENKGVDYIFAKLMGGDFFQIDHCFEMCKE